MTVLLVDDQRLFVESLRVYMGTRAPDLEVVGVAFDGREALRLARKTRPDLVVMDVRMPGMDGVEATQILAREMPAVRVLMLTTFDDDEYVFQALNHGAVGYLLKDLDPSELVEAMRAAISGSVQIAPRIATRLVSSGGEAARAIARRAARIPDDLDELEDGAAPPRLSAAEAWALLSRREREIVVLVVQGLDNQEIAGRLNIAEQTVKNRVSAIYTKLDLHSRLHLIRRGRSYGWLPPGR